MGMILTLFLIGVNIYTSVDAPKDRGISYIEIWTMGTQFPIVLALFEYGFILYLKRVSKEPINDERIKQLDFATMIVSLSFLIIFTCVFWIALLK